MGDAVRIFMRGQHGLFESQERRKRFLDAVARLAAADPKAIHNPRFRDGCVVFEAELDRDHAAALHASFQALRDPKPTIERAAAEKFVGEFDVTGFVFDEWWKLVASGDAKRRNPVKAWGQFGEAEFRALVKNTAWEFQRKEGVTVSERAIEELVLPGLPELEHVELELNEGNISHSFLAESLHTLLANAAIGAQGGRIEDKDVKRSMKKHCPYLFWC